MPVCGGKGDEATEWGEGVLGECEGDSRDLQRRDKRRESRKDRDEGKELAYGRSGAEDGLDLKRDGEGEEKGDQ